MPINGNDAADSGAVFIRAATAAGLKWDNLLRSDTDVQLQEISNNIAKAVIGSIVSGHGPDQPSGTVLGTDVTVQDDISSALGEGQMTIGGWGGAFAYWNTNYKDLSGNVQTVGAGVQDFSGQGAGGANGAPHYNEQKFIGADA